MMRWGVHVELGYAYYILGVKLFYASNSSDTCPKRWAVRAKRLMRGSPHEWKSLSRCRKKPAEWAFARIDGQSANK